MTTTVMTEAMIIVKTIATTAVTAAMMEIMITAEATAKHLLLLPIKLSPLSLNTAP